MTFCEYQVTGTRNYRGHTPGTIFEARHDPPKQRAIDRGDIRLLRIHEPVVPAESVLPDGWLEVPPKQSRAAEAALSHRREKGK